MNSTKQHIRISFNTLGCRLNQSETAVIERTFENDHYRIVNFNEPADIAVINTCTVTENGDADTRRLVNKINRINPKTKIALIGCQAQVQKEILTQLPNVQWVVGNAKKMDLKSIVSDLEVTAPQVIAPTIPRESFTLPTPGIDRHRTRANIKIQDGCDFFCSFCEIPYARGRARSREFEDIIFEAKALVAAGHKELVITGINVGTFQNNDKHILDVIDALERIEGLERIRISSIEPTTIPFELIERMNDHQSKLCRYLHIPLQSGDTETLQNMKRLYSVDEFSEFIKRAEQAVEGICIGTDVIVGFPGESEDNFANTLQLLKDLPIQYFHVFSYSARHLAKSKDHKNPIDKAIINERSAVLRDLSARKRHAFYRSFLGTTQKVLFEQYKDEYWQGVTDNYIRVGVHSGQIKPNQIHPIKLESLHKKFVSGIIDTTS